MKNENNNLRFAVLAVDVNIFRIIDDCVYILLGEVNVEGFYKDAKGLIGGLIGVDETAEQAVERHLQNKVGIKKIYKEQLYTFSSIKRDPRNRVVSVAYNALTYKDVRDEKSAKIKTNWFDVNDLPKLAYDHKDIVKKALERLKSRIEYTDVIKYLIPQEFTLTELQKAYEVLLDKKFDKRNFRKKVLSLGLLKNTMKKTSGVSARPAFLYQFENGKVRDVGMI